MAKRPPISIGTPFLFAAIVAALVATWEWPVRWLISGTPILSLCILMGAAQGHRILAVIPLWTVLSTLNLAYAISATSWLLYGLFTSLVYPAILFVCLFQFDRVARIARRSLRKIILELHFVHDTIALFDIPALEIDVDVDGLMVVRGLTISLSSLTVVAHGIEVGIKLTDDMELAISTETVTIALFRRIEVGDCFANIKGGHGAMTFGDLDVAAEKDEDGDALMVESTPLLLAANHKGDRSRPRMIKMKSKMTLGTDMLDSGPKESVKSIKTVSPEDKDATERYEEMIRWIKDTNTIQQCRAELEKNRMDESDVVTRAAICSKMQEHPSVPHPPKRSIKVTTLKTLSPPKRRELMHRMPMLLRLLLNPISYFHPVTISSITAGGSGEWLSYLLSTKLFKDYAKENKELRKLEKRILSWIVDANFVVELADIEGIASVPFNTSFDILAALTFGDVLAFRAIKSDTPVLEKIVRLGGADASFTIPSFLLPHHEHLLPPKPTPSDKKKLESEIEDADGKPKELEAEHKLDQADADEANVRISAHVQLPACFSQDLLNFIAALVKATKVVELEKEPGAMEEKLSGIKEFGHALSKSMKDSVKKTVVDGVISDKWIAKMVGKVTRKLEEAQGDVGYSGDIPVELEIYRLPEGHPENSKILP